MKTFYPYFFLLLTSFSLIAQNNYPAYISEDPQKEYQEEQTGIYSKQRERLSESKMDATLQKAQEGLEVNKDVIKAFQETQRNWRPYASFDGALGYNSNINLAPNNGQFKPITDGVYDVYALIGVDRTYWEKTYLEAEIIGSLHYYFWRNDLNYRFAEALVKASQLLGDSWVLGLGVTGKRMFQPKLLDLEERLVSQDFTYWGYNVNPFVTYLIGETWTVDGDLIFKRKKYHFVEGQFPYDNYEYVAGIKVTKDLKTWHFQPHFDWMLIHYTDLPPFNRLGTSLIQPNKKQYYQTIWGGIVTKDFDFIILSGDWTMQVRVDDFQGYENFVSNQFTAHMTYIPTKKMDIELTLSGMYEHRDYRHRRSVSQPQNLVKYDIFNVAGEYLIQLDKRWNLHGLLEFQKRDTNNNKSDHDRFYKQWNFQAGINAKF